MSDAPGSGRTTYRIPHRWRVVLALLHRLPQRTLSRLAGRLADVRLPRFLRGPVIGTFARLARIDTSEAEAPPADFPSVGAYFVRRLGAGARSWPAEPGLPGSPVDGFVGTLGEIEDGRALQAKGIHYSVAELLGSDHDAEPFRGGSFLTLYLSPRHYHRIHAPASATIHTARSIPGRLLPVNTPAIHAVPRLFPGNERLVVMMRVGRWPLALVAVGAYNVGRISTAFDPEWPGAVRGGVTNVPRPTGVTMRAYEPPLRIRRGEELAAFHLGSTVVLLFGPSDAEVPAFHPGAIDAQEIRLGAPLLDHPL